MKRSRFTEEQIIGVLKEHQAGISAADLCRRHGISDATKVRMVRKPTFRDVSSVLNVAHPDIYTANPKGQAFRQRVDAASSPIQTLRQQAVQDFLKNQKPAIATRASARQEYAVAKALFSPGFIIQ